MFNKKEVLEPIKDANFVIFQYFSRLDPQTLNKLLIGTFHIKQQVLEFPISHKTYFVTFVKKGGHFYWQISCCNKTVKLYRHFHYYKAVNYILKKMKKTKNI